MNLAAKLVSKRVNFGINKLCHVLTEEHYCGNMILFLTLADTYRWWRFWLTFCLGLHCKGWVLYRQHH